MNEKAKSESNGNRVVVVDIGKRQKKKAIRRLRKGRGKLMAKVESAVEEIKEETGAKETLPIVFVVRRKRRRRWFW